MEELCRRPGHNVPFTSREDGDLLETAKPKARLARQASAVPVGLSGLYELAEGLPQPSPSVVALRRFRARRVQWP